jgi:8-oxo-dGTP pyrophosphatase MutT (NUDIX family)
MTRDLDDFLSRNPHHCEFEEPWPIEGNLRVRLGLTVELPPESVRSSVLAIVISPSQQVVFLYPDEPGGNIARVLIGGRPEGAESAAETAIREVREETGWLIAPVRIIGYRHFHQTAARSEKSDRPHPDFVQPIFSAQAIRHDPSAALEEDFIPWRMLAYDEAAGRLPKNQHPLLMAALLR